MKLTARKDAKAAGASRYFTGEACARGHVAERSVANWTCVECKRDADRAQYLSDPQKFVRKAGAWAERNHLRVKELAARPEAKAKAIKRARAWKESNPERRLAYSRAWYASNKDKSLEQGRNRRARKNGAEGSHTRADIARILRAQRGCCAGCRTKLTAYHVDHIIPLVRGGSNWPWNLQVLCPGCNLQKHAKDPIEWRQQCGGLL